jgi:quercetin dioxygenase-like cupin family protein
MSFGQGDKTMAGESEHYVLAEDDALAVWFLGTLATIKADGARTGGALAVVEFTHPPGFATPRHVHRTADEGFYVLEGSMRGFCGDREWRASRGAFVWLPRGIPHGYAVEGDEPLRTLAFALPAGFECFVVEAGEPARTRDLPPPSPPDVEKLNAAAARVGIEHGGPPET